MALLEPAATLAVGAGFTDVDRAEIVFRVGVVRYSESSIDEAIVLFAEALLLAESSDLSADRLRSDILHWRARCHRRNRDWYAAQEDIERALELAEASSDPRRAADALFQASLVAQRQGRWVLARTYAEQSRTLFEELGDRATVARLLNNLAGLSHLLGDSDHAIALLEEAFAMFVDLDLAVDAGYVCSSHAGIQLDRGEHEAARTNALKALDLLAGRVDHLQEIGMAQLIVGRAYAAHRRGRRSREVDRNRRRDLLSGEVDGASQLRMARAGRRRDPTGRRRGCSRPLQASCSCAPGGDVAQAHGKTRPPATHGGERPRRALDSVVSSCRRTSSRQDWRGGRRVPSARRRDSAYFPW